MPSEVSRSSWSSNQIVWNESMIGLVKYSWSPATTRSRAPAKRGP